MRTLLHGTRVRPAAPEEGRQEALRSPVRCKCNPLVESERRELKGVSFRISFALLRKNYLIDAQCKIGGPGGARTPNPLLRRQPG